MGTTGEYYPRWSVLCHFLPSLPFQLTVFRKEREFNIDVMSQLLLHVEIEIFRKKLLGQIKVFFFFSQLSICSSPSNKVVDSFQVDYKLCFRLFRLKTFITSIPQGLSNLAQAVALKYRARLRNSGFAT